MSESSIPKRRRWLPQFRLRTLLLLMCVLGAALGIGGDFWRRLQVQRRAISQVEGAGGRIIYAHQFARYDEEEEPIEYRKISWQETPSGRLQRTRHLPTGDVVEYETPPGPAILRWFLGDNAFATVDGVAFDWDSKTDDLDPKVLQAFPKMRTLNLAEAQVKDNWLQQAAQLPDLRFLLLHFSAESSGTRLTALAQFPMLDGLCLSGKGLNDEAFRDVGELRRLKSLSIVTCPQLTSNILHDIKQLETLRSLSILKAHGIDDQGAADFYALAELRQLSLLDTAVGDNTLKSIGSLKKLQRLDLSYNPNFTDAGVKHLGNLRQLQHLSLLRTNVGDQGVAALADLREMRILSLGNTKITPASLSAISGMRELQSLDLSPVNLKSSENEAVSLFRSLTKLRSLRIGSIRPSTLRSLAKDLPHCEIRAYDETGSAILPWHDDE